MSPKCSRWESKPKTKRQAKRQGKAPSEQRGGALPAPRHSGLSQRPPRPSKKPPRGELQCFGGLVGSDPTGIHRELSLPSSAESVANCPIGIHPAQQTCVHSSVVAKVTDDIVRSKQRTPTLRGRHFR
eukprot:1485986-Amphidinium_carterae.1